MSFRLVNNCFSVYMWELLQTPTNMSSQRASFALLYPMALFLNPLRSAFCPAVIGNSLSDRRQSAR